MFKLFVMNKIAVQLSTGFEEIEAISIIDVLRRAEMEVVVVSITGNLEVEGAHKIKVIADQLFEDVIFDDMDMIVLPGGMPGSTNLKNHSGLKTQLLNFHKKKKSLGAICAAPLVFGNLGILKNKTATCYPGFEDQLLEANVTGNDVEIADHIITGKGAGVAIDFALKIVENLKGISFAAELGKEMMVK